MLLDCSVEIDAAVRIVAVVFEDLEGELLLRRLRLGVGVVGVIFSISWFH